MERFRWFVILSFVLMLGYWAEHAYAQSCTAEDPRITFDTSGKLISPMPSHLGPKDCLRFDVPLSDRDIEAPQLSALQHYLEAITGIKEELPRKEENEKLWGQPHFGVTDADLQAVQGELCAQARDLIIKLNAKGSAGSAQMASFFSDRLNALGCPAPSAKPPPPPRFVPNSGQLADLKLNMELTCMSGSGAVSSLAPPNPQNPFDFRVPADCSRLHYELRRANLLFTAMSSWWDTHRALLTPAIVQAQEKAALVLTKKPVADRDPLPAVIERWRKTTEVAKAALERLRRGEDLTTEQEKELFGDTMKALATALGALAPDKDLPADQRQKLLADAPIQKAIEQIESASGEVLQALQALHQESTSSGWTKHWLWLSRGLPSIDPFNAPSDAATLEAKRKELTRVEAELRHFELIASNDGFSIPDATRLDLILAPWGAKKNERDTLAKEVQALENKVAQASDLQLPDALLYQGLFPADGKAMMRHHDAQNRYILMDRIPVVEIAEDRRMFVLVANEAPQTRLKLAVTITPIQEDLSVLAEELALSNRELAAADSVFTLAEEMVVSASEGREKELSLQRIELIQQFLEKFQQLVGRTELLRRLAAASPFPLKPTPDTTPVLVSRIVPHDAPSRAPAQTAYVIKVEKDGTETQVGEGTYRFNKLYAVRFRTGLLYSELETRDFTVTNGQSTETIQKHGVDGTFGVQVYPWRRRDIRSERDRWIPVLYLGLSMKSTKDHLFGGVGFEPYSGLTLMYGRHLGRGEELVRENDVPIRTTDTWDDAAFYSLTVDIDFFKRLLSLEDLLN